MAPGDGGRKGVDVRSKRLDYDVHIRLTKTMFEQATKCADRLGISVSDLVRVLIDRGTHDVG